jgi:hypothetical protein
LVFVMKYRRGVFNDEMLTRCEENMRKVCEDFEAELREFNGERDHVHLLVRYPPEVAVSKLVNSLKGVPRPTSAPGRGRAASSTARCPRAPSGSPSTRPTWARRWAPSGRRTCSAAPATTY